MEGAGARWDTSGSMSQHSFRTPANTSSESQEVGEGSRPAEDYIFVAVPEEHGTSTLMWALQNLAKDGATIVIAHVRRPALKIPAVGIEDHTRTKPEAVDARRKKLARAEKKLEKYVMICRIRKVCCQQVIIEKDDVAKGLEELIALYGVTKLVMGAAADEHYSNDLFSWSRSWSKTALILMKAASKSCKIWFTCKGHLICTMEGDRNVFATRPSPTEEALREAERDLLSALEIMEDLESLNQHQRMLQLITEELLRRKTQEVEEIRGQLEATYDHITKLESARKDHKEELVNIKHILEMLQADNEKLQNERDATLTEAEDLRRKNRLSASDNASAPSYLLCPIYQEVMKDPHIAADGFTYEGEAITGWLSSGHDTSPMTNLKLAHTVLTPNRALRSAFLEWEQQKRWR